MTTSSIRVLLVLPFFYPHRGGSQKYAEELWYFVSKRHSEVKVDVLCYNTDKAASYEEYRNFRIYRIPCFNLIPARFVLANPVSLLFALIKLSKNKYKYVNTHIRFFDTTWWLWIYAKIIGAKSIFTGHVATHPVHQSKFVEFIAKLADLTIARFSLNFYDYITFTNQTAQKFFKTHLGVKKQTHIIYGGVDTKLFYPQSKQNRHIPVVNTLVPDNSILISFVGRLIWTKGVTYLYDAAKEIISKYPETVFVLAGPGELEKEMQNKITQDHLAKNVLLTGNLSYTQVKELLSVSDIFVNPSHHNEGFPNTILEAGSSGCYVIATDNAGTWEVVKNGETGQLIPQKDKKALFEALEWAINHQVERDKIAVIFRKLLINQFDWNVLADQMYDLIIK